MDQYIERFHQRVQHLCKFNGPKKSDYTRKNFNSYKIALRNQHGRRFIVLENYYGRRDVRNSKYLIVETLSENRKKSPSVGKRV